MIKANGILAFVFIVVLVGLTGCHPGYPAPAYIQSLGIMTYSNQNVELHGEKEIPVIKVTEVKPESLFDQAGLISGDRILNINGKLISDTDDFNDLIFHLKKGSQIKLNVLRIIGMELSCVEVVITTPKLIVPVPQTNDIPHTQDQGLLQSIESKVHNEMTDEQRLIELTETIKKRRSVLDKLSEEERALINFK